MCAEALEDQPPEVVRGKVIRTYKKASVLAGFMDDMHFRAFSQEHIKTMTKRDQNALFKKVEKARSNMAGLPAIDISGAEIRPLEASSYSKLSKDKTFNSVFGSMPYRFAWIKPEKLVALQVFVNMQSEAVPKTEDKLIDFALPTDWNVPAEISFIPPLGPIYVVSSSPQMAGLQVMMDDKKGQIILKPPSHVNIIQVAQFAGRYYLRNGYHRVAGAISAGVEELPALVVDAPHPDTVELLNLGNDGFRAGHFMALPRPPLVSDFGGDASVDISMREKRYGASVSLQISPLNIGV